MARVALIDCGIAGSPTGAAQAFAPDGTRCATVPPRVHHGSALAQVILHQAPRAVLLDAQVFTDAPATSAAAVAAAIEWAVSQGAAVLNLSLGLPHDRPALAQACANAVEAGALLIASSPARGGPVYPASYPRVLRVCGDARCGPGEFSALGTAQADIGACVFAPGARHGDADRSGASYATAYVSGRLAALLDEGRDGREALRRLIEECRWQGPERRV